MSDESGNQGPETSDEEDERKLLTGKQIHSRDMKRQTKRRYSLFPLVHLSHVRFDVSSLAVRHLLSRDLTADATLFSHEAFFVYQWTECQGISP